MRYETDRLILKDISEEEVYELLDYMKRNETFLEKWEPKRDEKFYSKENMRNLILKENQSNLKKESLILYIFKKEDEKRIIGSVRLNNIIYGIFLSCFLGYRLDYKEINNGYMTEAVKKLIEVAFKEYNLHRIEGNIIPTNKPSIKVLEKLGFICEGLSPKYLKINGKWEDHMHYVILNEELE